MKVKKLLFAFPLIIVWMISSQLFTGCQPDPEKLVNIIRSEDLSLTAQHGLSKVKESLADDGFMVHEFTELQKEPAGITFILATGTNEDEALTAMKEAGMELPRITESLSIKKDGNRIFIYGANGTGLMYALLDIAHKIQFNPSEMTLEEMVTEITETPEVKDRSISIYTMQRAWFEERLFNEHYWEKYFDLLAESRFNSFVVIFGYENGGFMAPAYPYFFNTRDFPGVIMGSMTPAIQKKNRNAFNRMIDIAHSRGIRVIAGIWDHIYRGGVQSGGLIDKQEKIDEPRAHMVYGLNEENLASYTKASIRQFLDVFPSIDGIQFRMHNESGLKNEEMEGFWHEVFGIISQKRPDLHIDIRAKELPDAIIDDAIGQGLNVRVATKYWMEQMGMPFHPTHINRENQFDRRHGYADLLSYPKRYSVHWRLWNGGTQRILLWGNPAYVRRFVESTQLFDGYSYEVNEPLATKMETQPQDQEPFDLLNPAYRYYDYEFQRYWYFYHLFGRLGYNPDTPDTCWNADFTQRFGVETGRVLQKGIHLASDVLPRIVTASYHYHYFPTTRGWAEKMHMGDLPFFSKAEGSDIQQFTSFEEAARNILEGKPDPRRSPFETSQWFLERSRDILEQVIKAENYIENEENKEFISTITDLKILANLARYYGYRMQAAVFFNAYQSTNDLWSLDKSMEYERQAIQAWNDIVMSAGDVYTDNLMMGICRLNMCGHWKDDLVQLKEEYGHLDSLRQVLELQLDKEVFSIHHFPIRRLKSGIPLVVKVTITGIINDGKVICSVLQPDGNYTEIEMQRSKPGFYSLEIPPGDNQHELFYFIKAQDQKGKLIFWPENGIRNPIHVIISDDEDPPSATLDRITTANVGHPISVSAAVRDLSGIRMVRLRYRHVTQFEDYQSVDMRYDENSGKFMAEIPGDFVINKWDVMYFIECQDAVGNGRLYPDLETEMPYIIVKLNRD
jgi:hypothetical protein